MSELVTPSQPGSPSRASLMLYRAFLAVTCPSRLPAARQIALGLAALALIFVVLVAFGISGTSSGVLYGQFFRGHDPQLLLGSPRPICSDEWLVAGPLTVAQVQQGLPRARWLPR